MLFHKLGSEKMRSPQVAVPVGMALMITGMMAVLFATVLSRAMSGSFALALHGDFIRGLVVGVSLGLELLGVVVIFRSAGSKFRRRRS